MIKKQWLNSVWMLLLILIFVNLIMSGILTVFMVDTTLISVIALALSTLIVGAFYGFVFGGGIPCGLRLFSGITFVVLQLLIALIVFWEPGLLSFNMIVMTLVLTLVYFAEIYFFLQGGALLSSYLLYGKCVCKKTKLKKVAKKKVAGTGIFTKYLKPKKKIKAKPKKKKVKRKKRKKK